LIARRADSVGQNVVAALAHRREVINAIFVPLIARRIDAVVDFQFFIGIAKAAASAVAGEGGFAQFAPLRRRRDVSVVIHSS
jgi:hypothetical protein